MTTSSSVWIEETVEVSGTTLQLAKAGTGDPLLIFHDEIAHPGWLHFHQALAQSHTLYMPWHPGFGKTDRVDWIMNMRDLAGWYLLALEELGLGPVNVLSFSMGGWLAAEIATMHPERFKKLVLVGAVGVKPPTGEIYDIFLSVAKEHINASIFDPASTAEFLEICPDEPERERIEIWENAREEACRLGWKPYMYYPALPHLLQRLKNLPSLIVWGREDAIVPLSAGEVYHQSIPGSRLAVLDNCGHQPQVEKPDEFLRLVQDFLSDG